MSRPLALLAALALLVPASAALWPAADPLHDDPEVLEDRLLLTFEPSRKSALAARVGALGGEAGFPEFLPGIAIVEAPAGRGGDLEARLRAEPGVLTVDHDRVVRAHFVPNDPRWTNQYGPEQIRAPEAWDLTQGSMAVKVAVLDTGIDLAHPDLVANICGTRVFSGEASVQDNYGHGTHVSGTVAAGLNNGVGIAGMGNVCILHGKVLDGNGVGSFSWLINGVSWAIGQGAKVITMSLGSTGNPGGAVDNAMRAAFAAGIFLDASAGNEGCPQILAGHIAGLAGFSAGYPAAYSKVMAVAATGPGESVAPYSSCGPQLDIAAPGSGILSTLPPCTTGVEICASSGYGSISGTSMAAPHVAGVAALMFSVQPALTPREAFCFLTFTAQPVDLVPWDPMVGWGEVDAYAAVKRARDGPPLGQGPLGQQEVALCDRMLEPVTLISSVL